MKTRYQRIVKKVDKSLEFVEKYAGAHEDYFVFKVKRGNDFFILKSSLNTKNEIEILKRLEDVKNITQIKESYGLKKGFTYQIILKEYVEGENLKKVETITDPFLQMQIADIVRECHKKNLAYLDVRGRNFVISKDGRRITYIDADHADFFDEADEKNFESIKKVDIEDLERLFGWR